ncbi:hypothetical protein FRC00_002609 [Tulasnella sp. 408]|nr:hypothetical protein FRC00_002609 [Tulasnella sp. 408]
MLAHNSDAPNSHRLASISASLPFVQEPYATDDLSDSFPAPGPQLLSITANSSAPNPSPISLLPLELLQEVFRIACVGRTASPLTPFHLSQVNPYFRSVALELKPIWTHIDDILPIPLANLYLVRSGDAPLDIRVGAWHLRSSSREFIHTWSDILAQYCSRIQSLEVETSEIAMLREWASSLDEHTCKFTRLRKFEYILHKGSRKGEDTVMCPVWIAFPDLWDVWIQGCWINGWVSKTDPFPPTLKRLKITDISELRIEKLVEALQAIPGLVTLILDDIQELPASAGLLPESSYMVTLENLKKLELSRISETEMVTLVAHVQTPTLSSLSASFARHPNTGGSKFLPDFTKAHPTISSLEVAYSTIPGALWSSILEQLPYLTNLCIFACHLTDDDLEALTLWHILPRLTRLNLDNELQLSTSFVEQVVRTHPDLVSVSLRGWDPSNISSQSLESIKQRVPHIYVETLRNAPEDVGQSEADSESDHSCSDSESDGEWLSGDEAVVRGNC